MEQHAWMAIDAEGEETEPGTSDQQGIVNMYATMMLQLIQLDPYMPIFSILEHLTTTGPFCTKEEILEEFGGWSIFRRTLQRMEMVRGRTVNSKLRTLPMTTGMLEDEPFGYTIPETDGYVAWWAPQMVEGAPPFMFTMRPREEDRLYRYPHMGAYTDEGASDDDNELDNGGGKKTSE